MKRLIDIVIAGVGLVLFVPVIAIAYAVVRLQSPGPGLFCQQRVGRSERPFTCIKLRTMYVNTPDVPTHSVAKSAITPVGRVLRNTKIDELPQLWNVLVGDMSLVGPRPCLLTQDELIRERQARGVFELRPGVTGLAQVRNIDMSRPRLLARVDGHYRANRTLLGDLCLIVQTPLSALLARPSQAQ